jgi:predicted transcriptional regulator
VVVPGWCDPAEDHLIGRGSSANGSASGAAVQVERGGDRHTLAPGPPAAAASKLEDLAKAFHRKRAPIVRYVLPWGLCHSEGWIIDRSAVVAVPPVSVLLEPELLQRVRDAAAAQSASVAAWVRHALRQVTPDDFPATWQAQAHEGGRSRSHDSPTYGRRFMLRLDESTAQQLQGLVAQFGTSRAEIIRQLVAQAKPEDFPHSWQLAARERGSRRTRP